MARASARGPGPRPISQRAVGRGNPVQFFQEVVSELRKSVWPTREETVRLTYIVILISMAIGFLLAGLDFSLSRTFGEFIRR